MLKNLYSFYRKDSSREFSLPKYAVWGISYSGEDYTVSFDSEYIFGKFDSADKKDARIWILRSGAEKKIKKMFSLRMGILYPVIMYTTTLGNIRDNIPRPGFGGAIGAGIEIYRFIIDVTAFSDPAKSYIEHRPVISYAATVIFRF